MLIFRKTFYIDKEYKPLLDMKQILLWTSPDTEPFKFIDIGRKGFISRNCTFTNCYVTPARHHFGDHSKFHAVVFAMTELIAYSNSQLPPHRSLDQKYVMASAESSHYYAICSDRFNGYFNWTWTYRLDSDCRLEYIAIRNINGDLIGPNEIMHWLKVEEMTPVSDELKKDLLSKTKAVAWFASNCVSRSQRELFVQDLQIELTAYNYTIDIYGLCGNLSCAKGNEECFNMIKTDYYFYLSFENSMSTDYVTEKLLHALKNNAVPVVYGYANYTRYVVV
ncbi:alpha-(1,3)-fucosyltransferase C-like [Amyelois transitella]|uniref:alpha-(1,3)-fucosyltransferase C-like n=1 Tax=Amyelois transitella TaxID=680683 RepID=UPI00067B441C|nr:alpha-(1,3)-fucosyltransferase C-like [Amyelois transitella]